jgi:(1->4)-alpha-D-glucan 1-alpha-D-glucosylmutase
VVKEFVARIDAFSASNSLSAKLVQLTMPGVPDVYQGSEFWERSLTDPDNRRPVDFALRWEELARIDAGTLPQAGTEASKLLVTTRALRLRRDRPELFQGYSPVTASGAAANHVLAFHRGASAASPGALTLATRLPAGLEAGGGWRDTAVELSTVMRDELTGAGYGPGTVSVADVLGTYPVALLVPVDGEEA